MAAPTARRAALRQREGASMKIVVFGPDKRTGALEGGKIADLSRAYAKYLRERRGESVVFAADAVQIHAPRPKGTRMACAGSNFTTHRERMTRRSGRDVKPPFIWGFWKIPHEGVPPDGDVIYPARCDRLDYEGELAVVLGKTGKDWRPGDLKDFVWGVTLFCDWSIRSPREPLGPMNFAAPKNFDTSYSLGPC